MSEYIYVSSNAFCAPDSAAAQQFQASSQNSQHSLRRGSTIFAAANANEAPSDIIPHTARKKFSTAFGLLMFAGGVMRRESLAPHISAALRARAPPLCAPGERPLRWLLRVVLFLTAASLSFGLASALLSHSVCDSLRAHLLHPSPPAALNASTSPPARTASPNLSPNASIDPTASTGAPPAHQQPTSDTQPATHASSAGFLAYAYEYTTPENAEGAVRRVNASWSSSHVTAAPAAECSPVAREGDNERLFAELVFTYLVLASMVFYYPLAVLVQVCCEGGAKHAGEHKFSVLTNIKYVMLLPSTVHARTGCAQPPLNLNLNDD